MATTDSLVCASSGRIQLEPADASCLSGSVRIATIGGVSDPWRCAFSGCRLTRQTKAFPCTLVSVGGHGSLNAVFTCMKSRSRLRDQMLSETTVPPALQSGSPLDTVSTDALVDAALSVHGFHAACLREYVAKEAWSGSPVECPQCTEGAQVSDTPPPFCRSIVVGVDVGGVLISLNDEDDLDTNSQVKVESHNPIPGALDGLRDIVALVGSENVHIVSKAGRSFQEGILRWLRLHKVFNPTDTTGVGMDGCNVHFVEKRWEKRTECQRLCISHFVDDRVDVLRHLIFAGNALGGAHRKLYLLSEAHLALDDQHDWLYFSGLIEVVSSWSDFVRSVRDDCGQKYD